MPPNYNCFYATHIDFKAFGATTAGCRSFILNVHVVKSMSLGMQSCPVKVPGHRTQSALLKSLGVAPPTQACCIGLLAILWFFAFLRMACVKACGVHPRERGWLLSCILPETQPHCCLCALTARSSFLKHLSFSFPTVENSK